VVKAGGKEYRVPAKNIDAKRETARCLYCGAEINHRVVDGRVVKPSAKKKVGDWYVKWALRQWNQNYERYLRGEMTLEELKGSPARPTLLVKVRLEGRDLRFEPADSQDVEKLWKAAEKLKEMWEDPDIPTEPIPPYGNVGGGLRFPVATTTYWYQLFNPRQLLTLVKLVKLIREVGRLAEEEKLREGWGREDAHKYAEVITTYLAVTLVRYSSYSNMTTPWKNYTGFGSTTALLRATNVMVFRGIAMTWNYTDYNIIDQIGIERDVEAISKGLDYIKSTIISSPGRVRVLLDDAASLERLGDEVFDVVVTDPPYADDVAYAELSDFYYVWLKRALSGVEGGRLVPRFLPEAFFDEFGEEVTTQWQLFAPREVSENEGRFKYFKMREGFADLLARAFSNVLRFLKPDGLLVVYYVAKKPESWVSLVKALWEVNGLEMVAAHPVATESEESVVARGKAAVLGGYVSAWRRGSGGRLDLDSVDAAGEVTRRFEEYLRGLSKGCEEKVERLDRRGAVSLSCKPANGATAWVYSYMAALSYLTSHREVYKGGVKLDAKGIVDEAVSLAFRALLKTADVPDLASKAYLALKILAADTGKADSDALAHVERALGVRTTQLVQMGLIRPVEVGGPKVAARKVFEVVMPIEETVEELRRVLSLQKKSSVLSCFRKLQLHLVAKAPVDCSPQDIEGALALARAINRLAELGILKKRDKEVHEGSSRRNKEAGKEDKRVDVDASLAEKILEIRWP